MTEVSVTGWDSLFTLIFQEMRLGTGRRLYDLFWRLKRSKDRHAVYLAQTQLFRRTVFLKIFLSVVAIGLNGRVELENHSRSSLKLNSPTFLQFPFNHLLPNIHLFLQKKKILQKKIFFSSFQKKKKNKQTFNTRIFIFI